MSHLGSKEVVADMVHLLGAGVGVAEVTAGLALPLQVLLLRHSKHVQWSVQCSVQCSVQ